MTGRPHRDLRDEAKHRLAALLRREQHPAPELLANELLIALDGIHIGLTDTSAPADPNADWHPPTSHTTGPTDTYRAARAALKGQQQ